MPACSGKYYFVYCINLICNRIDILDSIDYVLGQHLSWNSHRPVYNKMSIISAAFQRVTNNKFPCFERWSRPMIDLPKQAGPCDCMFFLWKYMEYWDGERLNIDNNPVSPFFLSFLQPLAMCVFLIFFFVFFVCFQFNWRYIGLSWCTTAFSTPWTKLTYLIN